MTFFSLLNRQKSVEIQDHREFDDENESSIEAKSLPSFQFHRRVLDLDGSGLRKCDSDKAFRQRRSLQHQSPMHPQVRSLKSLGCHSHSEEDMMLKRSRSRSIGRSLSLSSLASSSSTLDMVNPFISVMSRKASLSTSSAHETFELMPQVKFDLGVQDEEDEDDDEDVFKVAKPLKKKPPMPPQNVKSFFNISYKAASTLFV